MLLCNSKKKKRETLPWSKITHLIDFNDTESVTDAFIQMGENYDNFLQTSAEEEIIWLMQTETNIF